MADRIGTVYYDITVNDTKFNKGISESTKTVKKFDKQVTKSGDGLRKGFKASSVAVAGFATVFALGLKKAVKAASDLEESTGKFSVVFKGVEKQAKSAVDELVNTYGQSTRAAQDLLSSTGDLLKGFGLTAEASLGISQQIQTLSIDVASFSNATGGAEAVSKAFTSALFGEREAAKTYGVVITEAAVQQALFEKGQEKLVGNALLQAKAQATLNILLSQTKDAQGDAVRTASSFANVQRRVASRLEDISAEIGKEILPALGNLGTAFLEASKDGGILIEFFKGIVKITGLVVQSFANIINALSLFKNEFDSSINEKVFNKFNKAAQTTKKELIDTYGSIGNAQKKAVAGNDEALKKLFEYNEQLKVTGKILEERQKLSDQELRLRGDLANAFNDEQKKITNALNAREEARKKAEAARKKREESKKRASKAAIKRRQKEKAEALKFLEEINNIGQSETEAIEAERQKRLQDLEEYQKKQLVSEKQAAELRVKINKEADSKILQNRIEQATFLTSTAAGMLGEISGLLQLDTQNRLTKLDNETQAELDALDARILLEQEAVEASAMTEAEKNDALSTLDAEKARESDRIAQESDKKKRKLERKAAKRTKALSIATTALEIPQAAFSAFRSAQVLPFPASAIVGGILAGAATSLGLAKLALIKQTPLPALADGGLFTGPALIGEAGRELAVPLESSQGRAAIDQFTASIGEQLNLAGGTRTATPTPGTAEGIGGGVKSITVNIGTQSFYADIEDGISNGEIIINESDLVTV